MRRWFRVDAPSGGVRGFLATVTMRCSGGAELRRRRLRATPDTRSGDYPHLGGTAMKVGRMIRALCCMVLLCAISSGTVHAGDNTNGIYSYELIPAKPAPGEPFTLHIWHSDELALDRSETSIHVAGGEITITLGFFLAGCPPLLFCDIESTVPIDGLPEGAYRLHMLDDDGSPPFDAFLDFTVGNPPAAAIPTLGHAKMAILALLLVLAGAIAARPTRRMIHR